MRCIQILLCLSLATGLICAQNGIALSPLQPGEIRGSVIEPGTNHGIAEVEIAVRFKTPGAIYSPLTLKEVAKITTDDQGNFRFQPQEFGEYILQAHKDGYSAMSGSPMRGGLSTQISVTLDRDHPSRQVNFLLGREGELSGRLVDDETRQPLTNFKLD